MSGMEFVVSLVSDLAWPLAFTVALFLFRSPIIELIGSISKISHGDTAIAFDKEARDVGAALVAVTHANPTGQLDDVIPIGSQKVGEIVVAWIGIENTLRKRFFDEDIDEASNLHGRRLVDTARSRNLITMDQANSLLGLNTMRNLAVHGREGEINDSRVNEFLVLAEAICTVLEMTAPKLMEQ